METPPRLLVVDDDPEICSALARGLSLHGYAVETQNRADAALAPVTATTTLFACAITIAPVDDGLLRGPR